MGCIGWVVRFCQPSVQSPSWCWLPIVKAPEHLRGTQPPLSNVIYGNLDNILEIRTDSCQIMWNKLNIWVCEHNRTSIIFVECIFCPALLSYKLTKEFVAHQNKSTRVHSTVTCYTVILFLDAQNQMLVDTGDPALLEHHLDGIRSAVKHYIINPLVTHLQQYLDELSLSFNTQCLNFNY